MHSWSSNPPTRLRSLPIYFRNKYSCFFFVQKTRVSEIDTNSGIIQSDKIRLEFVSKLKKINDIEKCRPNAVFGAKKSFIFPQIIRLRHPPFELFKVSVGVLRKGNYHFNASLPLNNVCICVSDSAAIEDTYLRFRRPFCNYQNGSRCLFIVMCFYVLKSFVSGEKNGS